jgi:hypothetical protein
MITIQRKLIIKIKKSAIDAGKCPASMIQNSYYPVIGYSVQLVKRDKGEHEELTGFYFLNQKQEVAFVYSSYCEISLDPCGEDIANTELFKQGRDNNEEGKKD